jgi:ubiquinone/menaquinone biosynthesis C-methylase UbiE
VTPDPADVKAGVAGVFGRAASSYDSAVPFFATFAAHLVAAAQPQEGERVLDVACGRGAVLLRAAEAVGSDGRAVGIDLAPEMVEAARADAAAMGLDNVDVQVGDAERLDFDARAFDVALCGFGVFFFPDPHAALREVRRVLRPGGRFATSTFLAGVAGFPWAPEVAKELGRVHAPPQSPVLTAPGLRAVLGDLGYGAATTHLVEGRFIFRDVDHYVGWHWTQGGRRLLEQLDEDELRRYRDLSATRLEAHARDGGYELVTRVELTVARCD